ncbi:hypothetical protein OAC51_03965 [Flavobacteriaceae bacterium]|nr:hypothetical protein [Flavobacteriaceae bacterium]
MNEVRALFFNKISMDLGKLGYPAEVVAKVSVIAYKEFNKILDDSINRKKE